MSYGAIPDTPYANLISFWADFTYERSCPFFIICMTSMLLIVQGAVPKVLSHRYKEDIALFAEMGFKAFRMSISWSRIFPIQL